MALKTYIPSGRFPCNALRGFRLRYVGLCVSLGACPSVSSASGYGICGFGVSYIACHTLWVLLQFRGVLHSPVIHTLQQYRHVSRGCKAHGDASVDP